MNKALPMILLIGVLGMVGAYAVMNLRQPSMTDNSMESERSSEMTPRDDQDESMMMEDETGMEQSDEMMLPEEGRYLTFSPTVLQDTASNRRVLFFYANWCPTCRPADEDLSQSTTLFPSDVTVIRVNYNDTETDQLEKDLAERYGVTYQHTFVQIDQEGREVTKWNGGATEELLENLQ